MKAVGIVVGVGGALAIQYTLSRFFLVRGVISIDFVLVAVVYVALTSGPSTGMVTGTVAGLVQDSYSGGVIGIGGLAKTIVGFIGGIIGTQFIVAQPLPRFVVFFGATILHAVVFYGLYMVLNNWQFRTAIAAIVGISPGAVWAMLGQHRRGERRPWEQVNDKRPVRRS